MTILRAITGHLTRIGLPTLLIFFAAVTRAESLRCEHIFLPEFSASGARLAPQESSVEVEIGATPKVLELFTTTDGTIQHVFGKLSADALPAKIRESLQDYVGPGHDPLSAPWDVLSNGEKSAVIMAAAEASQHNFHESRKVPGLRYRDTVSMTFTEKTRFLGKDYYRGTYKFPAQDIFGDTAIEFMGPARMTKNLGFELHVRSFLEAGENLISARTLQKELIGELQNLHIHIVAPSLPVVASPPTAPTRLQRFWNALRALFKKPTPGAETAAIDAFRAADFTRRVALYFDVKMIENGINMAPIKSDGMVNFSAIRPHEFVSFTKALLYGGDGFSKSGTVGVRTSKYYDSDVWGIETRYLSPRLDPVLTARDLNTFQSLMVSGNFFMSPEQARAFLTAHNIKLAKSPDAFAQAAEGLLYASAMSTNARAKQLDDKQMVFLTFEVLKNDFLRMLVSDWSRDPMFYDKPERLAQIKAAQNYCLQLLFGGAKSSEVMQVFVKKSAIAYEIRQQMDAQAQAR